MTTYRRVVKAEHAGGLNVAVTFEGGVRGVFDFSPFAEHPCYRALKAPGVFACVRADHGTLSWPGEIDISPEAVWCGSSRCEERR